MNLRKNAIGAAGILILIAFCSSCFWIKTNQVQNQVTETTTKVQGELGARRFQAAIDLYYELFQKYPQEPLIRNDYVKTLEAIKAMAEDALEKEDFASAEDIYKILTDNLPRFRDFSFSLSFDRRSLDESVSLARTLTIEKQVRTLLEMGEIQRALGLYHEYDKKHSQDPGVRNGYIRVVELIKSNGDQAYEKRDLPLALTLYVGLLNHWPNLKQFSHTLSFNNKALEKNVALCASLLAEKQSRSFLERGDFKKALETHKEVYQRFPQNSSVGNGYLRMLKLIRRRADQMFSKKDFAAAGSLYALLIKTVPNSISHMLDLETLNQRLKTCRKSLFESGLERYRSGDLNDAISIWKSILVFDPDHPETKKALEMAMLQRKNLDSTK